MGADVITKKLLNKIIWMPYHRAWRLCFLCSILIIVCSGTILFPRYGYPIYDDCIEHKGIVKKFVRSQNQTNIYYSLELQNGEQFYINEPVMEVLDLSGAFKKISQGDYIEILSLNEKDGAYGPRVMALKKDGLSYLTYEQSKSVYQNIEIDSRKWIMMALSVLVFILLYLSAIHVIQVLFIRKIGKPIVINGQRKGIFYGFKPFVLCLLIVLAIIFIAGALNRYKDWKVIMDLSPKEIYLIKEIKASREILLWYFGATISSLLVFVPILIQRKKEGARPNP